MKCTAMKNGYADTLCKAIREASEYHPTKRTKGILNSEIVSMDTGDRKGARINISSGKYIEAKAVVANFCPFCGGELRDTSND